MDEIHDTNELLGRGKKSMFMKISTACMVTLDEF
jgi:hypothetical protein